MGVLQRFEKRLEGLVEGAFAKVFKGVVHPVEIASAMQREADAHRSILGGGRTLVPNRYIIDLSASDHDRLEQYAAALAQELAQAQAEFIGEQGWTVYGDVIVEIERGDGLDTGMFRVVSEVYTGSVEPEPPPSYQQGGYGGGPAPYAPTGPVPPAQSSGAPNSAVPYSPPPQGGGYGQPVGATARLVASDGRQYSLSIGSTVLGRGEAAQVRVADVGISRQHARLDFDGSRVVVTDLGSTNGTAVNGSRINAVALQPGDVIQVGTTTLTLRLDS
ncbi:antibiotic biosynthesis regulator FhaA [Fodinicola feengrottensis]|uniref:Antibiotic biosynthesis regulator FhaA n=1 Tax=Fodinicola feengrottensis TaxID=435914 RepID=A0ABN2GVF2_9ACTN